MAVRQRVTLPPGPSAATVTKEARKLTKTTLPNNVPDPTAPSAFTVLPQSVASAIALASITSQASVLRRLKTTSCRASRRSDRCTRLATSVGARTRARGATTDPKRSVPNTKSVPALAQPRARTSDSPPSIAKSSITDRR